ncbi:MAG: inositol monophosphatase [Patescibacteria group bacterium]|jgi:myo-inositol-1(or 4)-monophosphatase|nr:inositol monophosphatase [Patescibacteria group bacterium]
MSEIALKQFIVQVSAETGEYLRNHFYTFKNVIEHDSGNLVTNIDLELAEILHRRISRQYPDHQVIIQGDNAKPTKDYVWLIDPLEGSSHFSRDIPVYTTNIALQHNGQTILGTVNAAQTNQLFFAQYGEGAYLNGIRIKVSDQVDLAKAFVFVELPEKKFDNQPDFDQKMELVTQLVKQCRQIETFRIGSFGQCLVASGAFDAYLDFSGTSQALSHAASLLIVREAGGETVDLAALQDGFIQIMATNKQLTDKLKFILNV